MNEQDERRKAVDDLAVVHAHQERTRRAARLPWWVYVAVFVLSAGGMALNDFVTLGGAKLLAVLVMVALVVVLVTGFVTGSAPLSRLRGVQSRQSFVPWVFGAVAVMAGLGAWLISRYGTGFVTGIADATGLRSYPDTVAGVVYGLAFTAVFAVSQLLTAVSRRRTNE